MRELHKQEEKMASPKREARRPNAVPTKALHIFLIGNAFPPFKIIPRLLYLTCAN